MRKATVNGWVELRRRRYVPPGGGSLVPVDLLLDQQEQTLSRGLEELGVLVHLNARSFAQAAAVLLRLGQVRVSDETLRQVVRRAGQAVAGALTSGAIGAAFDAAAGVTATPAGQPITRVYASTDGVQVPVITAAEKKRRRHKAVAQRRALRKKGRPLRPLPALAAGADQSWKEVKVVACYDQHMQHKQVRATRGNHQKAGQILAQATAAIGFARADEAVGIADGAPWIRHQFHARKIPVDALGLDFYHLAEHVHGACNAVFGEGQERGRTQAQQLLETVRYQGYGPFHEALRAWRSATRSGRQKAAITALLHYVEAREEMIDYPRFERHGWQIGSGPIESCCKTVPRRLKGAGMRWNYTNLEAYLALECLYQSGQWREHYPPLSSAST